MTGARARVLWLVKGLGPGGAERLLVAAAAVHDRKRFTFETDYLLPWKDALVQPLEQLGVSARCYGVHDERDLRWASRLRRRLLDEPVDVLHAHSPYPAGIARLVARTLPRRVRPRLVYTLHNTWHSFATPTRVLNGLTLPLDAADIAVSDEVRDTMWPYLRRRARVIIHGVDVDAIAAQRSQRDAVRAELGIGPDEPVAGTIANFRAQKDYPNLLEAARLLERRGSPVRFVAVGQGQLEDETRALHARLGLGDRVLLLGRRDDAVRVLAACDVFTLASSNEGLPVAVMEAFALGLPVVATHVGGVPEAVRDGIEGILVPPREPKALADAIDELVRDGARRASMGAAARARGERFDIGVTVREIERVYDDVLRPPA
ncbi:MAG TPA: glycosyltransferase [Acidimicrobiia bacterium]|nr:glycosyltransferase [Acidimicrobiia bacterium]